MSTFRRRYKNRKSLKTQNKVQGRGGTKHRWANHFINGRRLQIEALEDRCVLSVATVTTPLDIIDLGDGKTSLREAIFFANALIGPDTIEFDSVLNGETISLTQGELRITDALTILGPGANQLTISALGSDPTPGVKNGDGSRVFNIDNANDESIVKVVLVGLTLTAGDVASSGGAVFSREDVTIDSSTLSNNSAMEDGGAVASLFGSLQIVRTTISGNMAANAGGVFAIGQSASMDQSSLFNNTALTGDGGGLYSGNDSLTVTSSTFSGNTAFDRGGGMNVEPRPSGTAVVQHSTITNNRAAVGGGIDISLAPLTIDHTIVAGNLRNPTGRDDIAGAVHARFSLIGDGTGATITNNGGNLIGTSSLPINAMLGPLADNGGPTLTHALLVSSPAVDAGDLAAIAGVNAPPSDQRGTGFERIENGATSGARIDIGAYEIQSGSIHGYKWNDLDGNGVWDQATEPGLPGWIVLLDTNKNGALDGGETWTVTDANGAYSFDGLAPANYTVGEVMLPGWTQTKPGPPQLTSLIVNGNFEAGNLSGWTAGAGWVINNGTVDPISPDGPLPPHSGTYSALFNSTGTRDIYQTVTLPANVPLTLRWASRIRNFSTTFSSSQQVRVEVRNTANQVLATLFSTQPGEILLQNWKEQSADITGFAGQTVRIAFVVVASSSYLNLHLDNVRITQGFENGQFPVLVGDGQTVNSVDFGNWIIPTGEIHGFKWNDLNGDGVWDQPTEPGLANWKIYLDANNNGALDPGEKWTTTAADGSYSFTGLSTGNYVVSELVEAGWVQTSPKPATPPLIVNGGFETGNLSGWTLSPSTAFVINNGTVDPTSTDGPLPPYQGSFSALSYSASSSSRYMYQDVSIPAQSHLTLHWADQIRNFYSSGFLDPSQEYRLEIRNLSNAVLATPFSTNPGDPNLRGWTERSVDLSAYAGQTIRITFAKTSTYNYLDIHLDNIRITDDRPIAPVYVSLDVGEVVNGVNFGNWIPPLAEIHGHKWNDLNGDGQWQQPAEPALEGVVVYLDSNSDGSLEFGESWTTTSADGSYAFTDLAPGNYVVMEVVPPGWTQTSPSTSNPQPDLERLFGVRGSGTSLTIYEFDRTSGATIRSYAAPTAGFIGGQGLAVGPHSLFFIEGSSSTQAHTLWELNPDTGAVIDSDAIDGANAGAIDGLAYLNGKVYIEKPSTNQIVVWDPVADTTVTTLTVGVDLVGGLTGAADLGVLFAVNNAGTIYRLDPNTGAVLNTIPPATSYAGIGLAYINGELIAVRSGTSGAAYRINPTSGAVLGTLTLSGTGSMSTLAGDGATATAPRGAQLVTLAANQIVTGINFGNWIAPPGEIHGYKWNDLDGDGIWDQPTEPALSGWLIYLDANHSGSLDGGERWTMTAADGSYSFTNLPAGEYFVAELNQSGWTQSYPNAAHQEFERLFEVRGATAATTNIVELDPVTGNGIRSFAAPGTASLGSQGLAVGTNSLFYIDGTSSTTHTLYELNPDTGAVMDSDIVDTSLLGTVDGLAFLNGLVYIQKPALDRILVWNPVTDTLVTTLTVAADLGGGLTGAADLGLLFATRSNGNIFAIDPTTGALYATYTSAIATPVGLAYVRGQLIALRSGTTGSANRIDPYTGAVLGSFTVGGIGTVGGLGGDGVSSVSRGTHIVNVAPGQSALNINFGNWIAPLGEIRGYKWNDRDSDGIWDQPTEPGLAGWQIFIDANGNGLLDPTETSTTTGTDGSYAFTGLSPGTYNLAEVLQPNWVRTFSQPFVVVGSGKIVENMNFGNHALPGTIAGQLWNDLNGDGIKDSGEPTLADWTVYIDQNTNGEFDEGEPWTLTDIGGNYFLSGVEVGTHTVAEVLQEGWLATHTAPAVQVSPGANVTSIDFGIHALPGSIHGLKWNDLDGDGVRDEGEPGLPGWTIFLDANENGVLDPGEQSATTDAVGNYVLADVVPGNYLVEEVPQAGWESIAPKTFKIEWLLNQLAANNAAISALVPNRYDFQEGDTGNEIIDGGNNMYENGNYIDSRWYSGIPYTNGTLFTTDFFGVNSTYFTAKYPGLFVLAATDMSEQTQFSIHGYTGTSDLGSADGAVLSTTIDRRSYTIFVKRVYGETSPSINHLIIVPGTGDGVQQYVEPRPEFDSHRLDNPSGFNDLFYLLVSSANGGYISNSDVLNIANAFLANVAAATIDGSTRVTVAPGQGVTTIDFASVAVPALPGDYNRNGNVDAADFVTWRKSLGQPSSLYYGADGNGNGMVDPTDYDVWRTHFGQTETATGSLAVNAAEQPTKNASLVSEPTLFTGSIVQRSVALAATPDASLAQLSTTQATASVTVSYSSNSSELRPTLDSGTKIRHMSAIAAAERNRWQDEGLLALLSQRLAGRSKADLQIDPDVPTDCTHSADVYFESYGEKVVEEAGDVTGARPVSAFAVQGKRPVKRSLGSRLR